ncbi:MAG TPA: type II secretion system protein [Planctomycetota bacterium]|nr:type II secretion system protein [Planctomycetota bacterium]
MVVARRAGFTLIELLAVLVILSILTAFLVTNIMAARTQVEEQATRATLTQIAAALSEYESEKGDWPPSSYPDTWGAAPDALNVGAEVLYMTICAEGQIGEGRFDEAPSNVEGDRSVLRVPGHASQELFEIADAWGNPIAYFHHRDYGREDTYQTYSGETGEVVTSVVRARKNARTGRMYEPRGFQLISPGPNGVFDKPGSDDDDDITNFKQ